jgi:hypothetical protein
MVDIEELFKESAFDCLSEELKGQLKEFCGKSRGKSIGEVLPSAIKLISAMPDRSTLTAEQRQAIVMAVLECADESERSRLKVVLKVLGL